MTVPEGRRPQPLWCNGAVDRPRLDLVAGPDRAPDLVVVAHGGQEHSLQEPHDLGHALLRMWPFAFVARRAAPRARVALLRYRYRGWNGTAAHPAADLRQALATVPGEVRRIVLVGHSMGGRAVFAVADEPRVVGLLGLAPWLPVDEPLAARPGQTVVLAHGGLDRVVDPRLTRRYARRLREAGVPVAEFTAPDEGHALLRRHGDWEELVRRVVASCLRPHPDPDLVAATHLDPARDPVALPRWSRRRGTVGAVGGIARSRLVLGARRPQ
jgi:dienelactone hydrolase